MQIKGKVAIVTGAGSGFGKALSIEIVRMGGRVVCADLNAESAISTVDSLNLNQKPPVAIFCECDVSIVGNLENLFRAAMDSFGPVDIFVGNAGVVGPEYPQLLDVCAADTILKGDDVLSNYAAIQSCSNINLNSIFLGTQLAIQHFLKHNIRGVVVNTASLAGLFGVPQAPVYAASKAGVVHFTHSMVRFHKSHGVRVNAVCPGYVKTAIGLEAARRWPIESWVPIESVTAAFVECIENEDLFGTCLAVTERGIARVPFAEWQRQLASML